MTSLSASYTPLPILRVAAEVHLGPPTRPPGGPDNYLQLICPQLRGPGRAPLLGGSPGPSPIPSGAIAPSSDDRQASAPFPGHLSSARLCNP